MPPDLPRSGSPSSQTTVSQSPRKWKRLSNSQNMRSKPDTPVPSSRLHKKSTAGQSSWLGPFLNGLLLGLTRSSL